MALIALKWILVFLVPAFLLGVSWRGRMVWALKTYFWALGVPLWLCLLIDLFYKEAFASWRPIWLFSFLALTGAVAVFGVVEFFLLRLLGLLRVGALARVTYYETLLQPLTLIVLALTLAILGIAPFIPYYTFNEDNKMLRDIVTQFAMMATLGLTVFSAAKVVDEEIENRTMLTLMSKPISRVQVILGKYLGILCFVLAILSVLYIASAAVSYLHWFDDKRIDYAVSKPLENAALQRQIHKYLLGFFPMFVLQYLEIATLAAIALAISTRYGLALNLTIIAMLYVVANLTVYVPGLGVPQPWKSIATFGSHLLPFLSNFDISQRLIFGDYALGSDEIIASVGKGIPSYGQIWQYTGLAAVYALLYIGAALSLASVLFRTRELT